MRFHGVPGFPGCRTVEFRLDDPDFPIKPKDFAGLEVIIRDEESGRIYGIIPRERMDDFIESAGRKGNVDNELGDFQ